MPDSEMARNFFFSQATATAPAEREASGEEQLVERACSGDGEAFKEIYRMFAPLVHGIVLARVPYDDVKDIVQEVFLALMRDASRYDPARASLTTYLYGSARHHTRRRLLRDRFLVRLEDQADLCLPAAAATAAEDLIRQRDVQHVRRAIVRLPARYREVIVLCDLQDVSYADAAHALGCAIGTVRSRLHRARHLLADKLLRGVACVDMARRPTVRCEV